MKKSVTYKLFFLLAVFMLLLRFGATSWAVNIHHYCGANGQNVEATTKFYDYMNAAMSDTTLYPSTDGLPPAKLTEYNTQNPNANLGCHGEFMGNDCTAEVDNPQVKPLKTPFACPN